MSNRAIFIDRDGTLNEDVGYAASPDEIDIYPWSAEAVQSINESGFKAIVVTNQSGIARGILSEEMLSRIHAKLLGDLAREGARIDAIYYCPHHPRIGPERYKRTCQCRKPAPGMLLQAARDHDIDLSRSFVIGDKSADMNLATNAGARGVLVLTGYGKETLQHPEIWPCEPTAVSDNLLDAVHRIKRLVE
jgi:D-glycero-D-manno-heptose 1,7-bisphosphate phosphatase